MVVNEADYVFSESLSFTLEAKSPRPVTNVVLRYEVGTDLPRNRRIPESTLGTSVSARHEERLARGQIPPAATIRYVWTLELEDGTSYDTAPRSIDYFDRRFEWRSADFSHIRVWWYDGEEDFAEEVASDARDTLGRLADLIGFLPDRQINIVTYGDLDDMRRALVARGDVYEARLATLGARVAPDTLLLLVDGRRTRSRDILAHELGHIVLHLSFDEQYVEAPMWLDEGVAMYAEGELSAEERSVLDDAIAADRLMSLRSLTTFPGQAELVPLAYAQSRDLVSFLIEQHGNDSFQMLLYEIGTGEVTPDEALESAYGLDQDSLYQAYRTARGLGPATDATSAEEREPRREAVSRRPRAEQVPGGGPCASIALVLPAVGLWWAGDARRRRES